MGSRIANRLLDAGHRVYATNRTAAKAQPLVERGLVWLGREYLVCERCESVDAVDPARLDEVRAAIREQFVHHARFSHFPITGLCASSARQVLDPAG